MWTETSRTNLTAASTTSISFTGAFTAGRHYRIRGRNLRSATGNHQLVARLLDDTTEITATEQYLNGIHGTRKFLFSSTMNVADSAWAQPDFFPVINGGNLADSSFRDGLGICFDINLFISPTPTTDGIVCSFMGWGWGIMQDGADPKHSAHVIQAGAYVSRTTPPDGIKFYMASGAFDEGIGGYIAYDSLDSEFHYA